MTSSWYAPLFIRFFLDLLSIIYGFQLRNLHNMNKILRKSFRAICYFFSELFSTSIKISLKSVPKGLNNWQRISIISGNAAAPNRLQANIWTDDDPIPVSKIKKKYSNVQVTIRYLQVLYS